MKNRLILILGLLFMFFVSATAVYAAVGPEATITPNGGNFNSGVAVNFQCSSTFYIYYTLDGTQPTTSSPIAQVYWGGITAYIPYNYGDSAKSVTLRYFAYDPSLRLAGPEGSAVFNFDSQAPVTSTSIAPGMYRTAQSVQLTADKSPVTIYYTTDGSDSSTFSPVYDGTPINVSGDTIIKAFAVDSYGNVEAFQTFQYFINPDAPELMPAVMGPGIQLNPQLWQDKVVYKSDETGNFETYMKDLKTGVTTQLTSGGVDTHAINYDGYRCCR